MIARAGLIAVRLDHLLDAIDPAHEREPLVACREPVDHQVGVRQQADHRVGEFADRLVSFVDRTAPRQQPTQGAA